MKEILERFRIWLEKNYKEGLDDLNPPATDKEIAELEKVIGFKLPLDFTACLKIHNGQRNTAGGIFDGSEFLSTKRIADEWKVWKGLLDGGDFNRKLIRFCSFRACLKISN